MGEHKEKKLTERLSLTLLERIAVHRMLQSHKPSDRDDERAMLRVWDAIDLDGLQEEGTPDAEGRITYPVGQLKKARVFHVDKAHVDWLHKLPAAPNGETARLLSSLRDQVEKARDKLK